VSPRAPLPRPRLRDAAVADPAGRVFAPSAAPSCFAARALDAALGEPLLSRWSFDVELLGRLLVGGAGARAITEAQILEIPLPDEPSVVIAGARIHIFARNPNGSIWHAHLPR
jgi:hypothetical protein